MIGSTISLGCMGLTMMAMTVGMGPGVADGFFPRGVRTWDGGGDGQSWSDAENWDPTGVPGATDDVYILTGPLVLMDVGTQTDPAMIASLTVDGGSNGGLMVLSDKGLRINGLFLNIARGATERYTLLMKPHCTLQLVDQGAGADLVRISGTMEPVLSGEATELHVGGAIRESAFVVNPGCVVTADGGITGAGPIADDWTVSGGTVSAGPSVLWGDWILFGADVTFDQMTVSTQFAVSVVLQGGTRLRLIEAPYGEATFPSFVWEYNQDHGLNYGSGANVLDVGRAEDAVASNLQLGKETRIGAWANGASLALRLNAELYIESDFAYAYVRQGWDARGVDIFALPIQASDVAAQSVELISPNLEPWYQGNPVIFLDVPCMGTWRDLVLPAAGALPPLITSAAHWWDNSWIDDLAGGGGGDRDASGPPEAGFFRNITVGTGRTFVFYEVAGKVYYYGTRTIDPGATIYYWPAMGDPFVVTHQTEPSLGDLIVPAVGTIYGDWNGDCAITCAELAELRAKLASGAYDPLMDYNCDGQLLAQVELAAFQANFRLQPSCGGWGGWGDCTRDGRVDLMDYAVFPACLTGPGGGPAGQQCGCLDADCDADIDLADFAVFQIVFEGP